MKVELFSRTAPSGPKWTRGRGWAGLADYARELAAQTDAQKAARRQHLRAA